MAEQIDADYINKCVSVINWDNFGFKVSGENAMIIALLCQLNLQMSRLSQLLMIATGIEDNKDNVSKVQDEAQDVGDIASRINETVEEAMKKNVVCGSCGNGVLPNKLGYCPRCNNDLKKQVHLEVMNNMQVDDSVSNE